jgi:hypothetical protein
MTNEEIKTALIKLYECKTDFTVIQTGKQSSKVNGLYKTNTHEILLHNKNFTTNNAVMYTAIHELTHHILTTEKGVRTVKSHSGIFWATFYDLIDKAIELKLYVRERSAETAALIKEAVEIQKKIIEAQKQLGLVIAKLYDSCQHNGERIEDVIEHDLQMTRNKAKEYMDNKMSGSNDNDEIAKAVKFAKDPAVKQAAQQAADAGKTVAQVKAIAKQKVKATDDNIESPEQLEREAERLKKTIAHLYERLMQIQEKLESI